jgi:hypothetical protein
MASVDHRAQGVMPLRGGAFGLGVESWMPLPGGWRGGGEGLPALSIEPTTPAEVRRAWSGADRIGWQGRADGRDVVVEHGRNGDLRIRSPSSIAMHLSSDGARLLVSHAGADDWLPAMRLLLDSALFTVSLRRGYEALHAGAVATDAGVLAVAGPTGAGKSSTVEALLRAGGAFHADDVLVLQRGPTAIQAMPGPPVFTAPNPVDEGVGEVIADLGDESWLSVAGAAAQRPLAGVLCLDPSGEESNGWAWLIGQMLRFPRTSERERARFELVADIAASVPILRVPARSEPPAAVARRALGWLASVQRA